MNWRDGAPAVATSVVLHLLVVGLVVFSWAGAPELRKPKPAPPHIQAVVMERPKPAAPQPAPRPRPERRPAPRPEPEPPKPKPAPKPEPKPAEVPRPQPTPRPEPKPAPAPEPAPSFEQPDLAELLAEEEVMRAEQREAAREEQAAAQQSDSDSLEADPETAEYIAAIQSTVSRRWSRPPSARNGMEVKLAVRLAPGGDVLNVTVQQSSGDAALDRTAVAAVKNAGRLPVPDGAAFEKFREFTFLFRPEDMRL